MAELDFKRIKPALLLVFPILITVFLVYNFAFKKASASWWNESWYYRKAVTVTNSSGSDLTDFQVNINVGTSALIAANKMNSDCSDIRITDSSSTELPYWIEENNPGCNTPTDTKVWVKASSIPTSGTTLYLYYGNPSAADNSDGSSVFEFFDDFSGDSLDGSKWQQFSTGTPSLSGGFLTISSSATNSESKLLAISAPTDNNYILRSRYKHTAGTNVDGRIGLAVKANNTDGQGYDYILHDLTNRDEIRFLNDGLAWGTITGASWSTNTFYTGEIYHNGSSVYARLNDGTWYSQAWSGRSGYLAINVDYFTGTTTVWDYAVVRKAVANEPSTSLDSEEYSLSNNPPLAHWSLDEGTGTTVYDSSTNRYDGSLGTGSSAPSWQTESVCTASKCLDFDGTDDYLGIGSTVTGIRTVSFWVNPDSDSEYFLALSPSAYISASSGTITATGFTDPSIYVNAKATSTLTSGSWQMVTVITDPSPITAGSISLGKVGENHLGGLLDEVKFYGYVRSSSQIKAEYNSPGSEKGAGASLGNISSHTAPIAYWKFDEGYGTSANNSGSGGSSYKGTFGAAGAAPTWTNNGKYGKALSFDGGDTVDVGTNSPATSNHLTLSTWININSIPVGSNGYIIAKGNDATANSYGMAVYSSDGTAAKTQVFTVVRGVGGSTTWCISSAGIFSFKTWSHLVGVIDGQNFRTYLNGKLIASNTFTGTISSSANTLTIGRQNRPSYNYNFNGLIDEVKIYNYALSESEIKLDYNQGKAIILGTNSSGTGNTAPAGASSQKYCVPGDSSACSSPVGEWKLDEGKDTYAYDSSSNSNTGNLGTGSSSPSWINGKIGRALSFDGNDSINAGNGSTLDITNAITIEAWVKIRSYNIYQRFISKLSSTSPYNGYEMYLGRTAGDARVALQIGGGNSGNGLSLMTTTDSIDLNKWVHIAGTVSGITLKIYVNGVLVPQSAEASSATGIDSSAANLTIGSFGSLNSYFFNGGIDQVRVFNYARSPAQIAWDYNQGKPIAHWKLDDCQGSTAYNSSENRLNGNINIGASGTQDSLGTCSTTGAWANGSSGKFNSSLNFDGSDDYLGIGSTVSGIQSVSFWVKPASNTDSLLQLTDSIYISASSGLITATNFSTPGIYVNGKSSSTLTAGVWQMVTVTTGTAITGNNIKIAFADSSYLEGQVDDVRVYNYTPTAEQIKTIYNESSSTRFGP